MKSEKIENSRFCRETRVIQTHRIFPSDTNHHGTLFGGKLMSLLDDCTSISAQRFSRASIVTASVDTLNFLKPLPSEHSVCLETFVSGAGRKSIEVFAKVLGEDLRTGERYLAATSFLTFVATENYDGSEVVLPAIVPETAEERFICGDYAKRRAARQETRGMQAEFDQHISIEMPW